MRRKEIKSLAFFRDLGGIKTTDNKVVKKGLLYRSSEIKNVSKKDLDDLINEYHVSSCIDLRTDEEVSLNPDELRDRVSYHHIPLVSNEDNPAVTKDTRIDILKMRMKEEGGMKGHITRLYRLLATDQKAIDGYKEVFKVLLNEEGVIYHCTQGKDRTGLISAFILSSLGVDKETIINDYLRYNKYHRLKRFWIFAGMSIVFLPFKAAMNLNYALVARRVFIEAAFEEIEKRYSDVLTFLKKAVGLTDENLEALKGKYLQNA